MDTGKTYELTADEILYLSVGLGMDTFYGVPDGLSGLSWQMLQLRIMELQDSLCRKEYMQPDFDGNNQTDSELLEMLSVCGDGDGFICFESSMKGGAQTGYFYFVKGRRAYKMTPQGEQYLFAPVLPEEIKEKILNEIVWKETLSTQEHSFSILQKNLEKAAKLTGRDAGEQAGGLLKEAGAGPTITQAILDGISRQADFYSLFFYSAHAQETPGLSVQFLQGKILTRMEYDTIGDEDSVTFCPTDRGALETLLRQGLDMLIPDHPVAEPDINQFT